MKGAKIVMECLVEQGVDSVFGYPGGTILNIYDALYDYKDKIKHYLTSHEQGAAHAADGYARSSGKVGVCFATSGPGATNLVTGLATAYMDSVPVVAITCNVAKSLLGRDTFQEVDIAGITMPITKHNYIVYDVEKLADTIREAFYIAKSGRPGPVLIDIPKDITVAECEFTPKPVKEYVPQEKIDSAEFDRAVARLNKCKQPMIIAGGGVVKSNAESKLYTLVKKLNCPIANTLMGLGSFPQNEKHFTGMVGMHGTKASNHAVSNCDLLIAIGMRFSDRVTSDTSKFAKGAKVLHIDIDPAEINKNIMSDYELIGDAKLVLQKLLPMVEQKTDETWLNRILEMKENKVNLDSPHAPLNPQYILESINTKLGDDAIVTTEVGQNQMWTAQYYKFNKPRKLITSGGLGTMGFGTGASIGCKVANPNTKVVAIAGDGSFRMNCNELATVDHYDLPIVYVILNNQTLGMVRQWQTLFYSKRYSETTLDRGPDFKMLAEAFHIKGYEVETKEQFEIAIEEALQSDKPALIDCRIITDECVLPMVAPGKPIQNVITEVEKEQ